jgi:hypothetical protein
MFGACRAEASAKAGSTFLPSDFLSPVPFVDHEHEHEFVIRAFPIPSSFVIRASSF